MTSGEIIAIEVMYMPKNVDGTVWLIERTHHADRKSIQRAFSKIVKAEGLEPSPNDLESYHRYWERVSAKLLKQFA